MTLKSIWFKLDQFTSYIFLPLLLFLDHSINDHCVLYENKLMNAADHTCLKRLATKDIKFLITRSVLSIRLVNTHLILPITFITTKRMGKGKLM
jgi:hypothetical protein